MSFNYARHVVIDVESTGPTATHYSMIEIGATTLNGKTFHSKIKPVSGKKFHPDALHVLGIERGEDTFNYPDRITVAFSFYSWLLEMEKKAGAKLIAWSDNPAFDWQFINDILHEYKEHNPLGHSMRRIGDFYAGLKGNVTKASEWKKLRDTAHTHNALDDAIGNAEALKKIIDESLGKG